MVIQTNDDKFATAKWIVDPTAGVGTHTTINDALTAASSGETIFIRPGTYTENPTLNAGVNLVAFDGDQTTPNVTIVGNCSASFAGTCTLSGIRLQTNSAAFLTVSGSSATIINLDQCYLNASNNNGISFSSSSSSSEINIRRCNGDIGRTGIGLYSSSAAGSINIEYCNFSNSGGSSSSNTNSAGSVVLRKSIISNPCETSSTGGLSMAFSGISTGGSLNITSLIANGSGSHALNFSQLSSGTATALTIGASATVTARDTNFLSQNANLVSGTGTLNYGLLSQGTGTHDLDPSNLTLSAGGALTGSISFDGGNNYIDYYETGSWTPTVAFGGGSTGITYSFQAGSYVRIGNFVYIYFSVGLTNKGSSTGNATIEGLPFSATAAPPANWQLSADRSSGFSSVPSGTDLLFLQLAASTTSLKLQGAAFTSGGGVFNDTHFNNSTVVAGWGGYLA